MIKQVSKISQLAQIADKEQIEVSLDVDASESKIQEY